MVRPRTAAAVTTTPGSHGVRPRTSGASGVGSMGRSPSKPVACGTSIEAVVLARRANALRSAEALALQERQQPAPIPGANDSGWGVDNGDIDLYSLHLSRRPQTSGGPGPGVSPQPFPSLEPSGDSFIHITDESRPGTAWNWQEGEIRAEVTTTPMTTTAPAVASSTTPATMYPGEEGTDGTIDILARPFTSTSLRPRPRPTDPSTPGTGTLSKQPRPHTQAHAPQYNTHASPMEGSRSVASPYAQVQQLARSHSQIAHTSVSRRPWSAQRPRTHGQRRTHTAASIIQRTREKSKKKKEKKAKKAAEGNNNNSANSTRLRPDLPLSRARQLRELQVTMDAMTKRLAHLEKSSAALKEKDFVEGEERYKRTFQDIRGRLTRLTQEFMTGEERAQDSGATKIAALWRGYRTRKRFRALQASLASWRLRELGPLKRVWLKWLVRRRQVMEQMEEMKHRRDQRYLRQCIETWREEVAGNMLVIESMRRRREMLRDKHFHKMARRMLVAWLEVAQGPHSRKIVTENYNRRREAVKQRLTTVAESSGWTGRLSEAMIRKEMNSEAVQYVRRMNEGRTIRNTFLAWQKIAKRGRADKFTVLILKQRGFRAFKRGYTEMIQATTKAHTHFRLTLLRKVFHELRAVLAYARKTGGARFGKRINRNALEYKLELEVKREHFLEWRRRTQTIIYVRDLVQRRNYDLQTRVFLAFCKQVRHDRRIRAWVLERWIVYTKMSVQLPFRRWYLYTMDQRKRRKQVAFALDNFNKRKQRRRVAQAFIGWRKATVYARPTYRIPPEELKQMLIVEQERVTFLADALREHHHLLADAEAEMATMRVALELSGTGLVLGDDLGRDSPTSSLRQQKAESLVRRSLPLDPPPEAGRDRAGSTISRSSLVMPADLGEGTVRSAVPTRMQGVQTERIVFPAKRVVEAQAKPSTGSLNFVESDTACDICGEAWTMRIRLDLARRQAAGVAATSPARTPSREGHGERDRSPLAVLRHMDTAPVLNSRVPLPITPTRSSTLRDLMGDLKSKSLGPRGGGGGGGDGDGEGGSDHDGASLPDVTAGDRGLLGLNLSRASSPALSRVSVGGGGIRSGMYPAQENLSIAPQAINTALTLLQDYSHNVSSRTDPHTELMQLRRIVETLSPGATAHAPNLNAGFPATPRTPNSTGATGGGDDLSTSLDPLPAVHATSSPGERAGLLRDRLSQSMAAVSGSGQPKARPLTASAIAPGAHAGEKSDWNALVRVLGSLPVVPKSTKRRPHTRGAEPSAVSEGKSLFAPSTRSIDERSPDSALGRVRSDVL